MDGPCECGIEPPGSISHGVGSSYITTLVIITCKIDRFDLNTETELLSLHTEKQTNNNKLNIAHIFEQSICHVFEYNMLFLREHQQHICH